MLLKIIYCLFNEIIGVLLLNVLINGVYRHTVFTTDKLKLLIQRSLTSGHIKKSNYSILGKISYYSVNFIVATFYPDLFKIRSDIIKWLP